MASFTPYADDDPSAHDIVPTLKAKGKRRSALRGIGNLVKNPKAALGKILKTRAAGRRQRKKAKEVESSDSDWAGQTFGCSSVPLCRREKTTAANTTCGPCMLLQPSKL